MGPASRIPYSGYAGGGWWEGPYRGATKLCRRRQMGGTRQRGVGMHVGWPYTGGEHPKPQPCASSLPSPPSSRRGSPRLSSLRKRHISNALRLAVCALRSRPSPFAFTLLRQGRSKVNGLCRITWRLQWCSTGGGTDGHKPMGGHAAESIQSLSPARHPGLLRRHPGDRGIFAPRVISAQTAIYKTRQRKAVCALRSRSEPSAATLIPLAE